ncbi:coiled-coil domain-containing protein 63 [Protopterus annectens]|uniref:coiled-coil domain-containing protein 63 n=1 Tax=Protopterus annectens TaxID=7888 RepID=UPI001CFB64B7|nr:coiled-coil domain-containing protein 63 [Protopterus annectens]
MRPELLLWEAENKATIRFDNFLAKNAKLREDVETLEIQKTLFEKLSKKLKSMLSQQRKNMEEVITQSVQAYEQRAEAQARILVLKERNLKDLVQFDAEIKELKRIIDHETKLITFMQIKLAELPTGEEEDTPTLEGADSKAKDRDDEETLENYQGILTEMAKLTGHKDADDFINKLIEKEQEIFAGFSYINELNSEVKDLYHEVERLENEILKLQSIRKYAEEEVCRNIKEVEEKLQKTTKDADLAESHYNDERKNLDHLKLKTELLFKNIKSDSTNITNKLGCSNGAMDSNILDYLECQKRKIRIIRIIALWGSKSVIGVCRKCLLQTATPVLFIALVKPIYRNPAPFVTLLALEF